MIRSFSALALFVLGAGWCLAADPVTLELQDQTRVRFRVVTIGSVAIIRGGDAALREQIAGLDVADLKANEQSIIVTRRVIEYRLRLAGIDLRSVLFSGSERTTIMQEKRTVSVDEVVDATRNELYHWLTAPRESVTVELARPVVVRLPEVPAGEVISITASPHVKPVGLGRIKMNVVIATPDETLLALGVDLEVKPINRSAEAIKQITTPAPPPIKVRTGDHKAPPAVTAQTMENAGVTQAAAAMPINASTVLVKPRQRVTMYVHSGGLNVSAVGEALQEGRMGQTILVQNIDSKKTVSARVSGTGTVEIDLDGVQK